MNYIKDMPVIAILRGIKPEQALAVSGCLYDAGIRVVEVTLNSENAFTSLELIVNEYGDKMLVGAGTVLQASEVDKLARIGVKLVISPNCDADVIATTKANNLISAPGCFSPTECFNAVKYGADYLKIFPAASLGVDFIKNIKAVIKAPIIPTGGIDLHNMNDFLDVGVEAIGMGSALYSPKKSIDEVYNDAVKFVDVIKSRQQ